MARKQKFDYFQGFVQISDCAVEYAEELVKYLEKNVAIANEGRDPDVEYAIKRYEELHDIECRADHVKHGIVEALSTEFISPIEREDIMALADELDDMVDDLDEILQCMYMYDVHAVPPSVVDMIRIIEKSVRGVQNLCSEFVNFKKSNKIREYVVEINDCEEEGDRVYIQAMHDTYAHARANGSIEALGISRLLTVLEKCCDACESVSDTVVTVIMKNS